jgi:hypothetical protein
VFPGAPIPCSCRGALAEWLGRGLQSLVRRFESARRLSLQDPLYANATQAVFGEGAPVAGARQTSLLLASPFADYIVATVHPSSILRRRDEEARRTEHAAFVADLRVVAKLL